MLRPHAQTVPSLLSARDWSRPPAIAVTPVRPLTCTGRDRPDAGGRPLPDRGRAVAVRAVATLRSCDLAPCPDRAVALEREGVETAARDRADAGEAAHLHRRRAVGGRAIAELPVEV